MRTPCRFLITIFLLITVLAAGGQDRANQQDQLKQLENEVSHINLYGQKILLLHSYHTGFKWTDDITQGVKDVLGNNVTLFVEYMDTKRQYDEAYTGILLDALKYKFERHNFQLIICSDNNAFDLVLNRGREIFGHIPIVFCGLNYPEEMLQEAGKNVTGVIEQVEFLSNLELIRELHPDAGRLVFITDNTPTGKRLQREFTSEIEPLRQEFKEVSIWYDFTMQRLLKELEALPEDAVVLFSLFFRDSDGTFYEWDQGTELITRFSPVPVYGVWDFNLGHGVVGGKVVQGYNQGYEAGALSKKILTGTPVYKIPIRDTSPNAYCFDYDQLKKFSIPLAKLPAGSIITNQPRSIIRENMGLFIAIFSVIFVLLAMVITLVINILLRHRVEKDLKRARNYILNIIDSISSLIIGVDTRGRITEWNSTAAEACSLEDKHLKGHSLKEVFPGLADQMELIEAAIEQRKVQHKVKTDNSDKANLRYEEITVYPLVTDRVEGAVIRVDDKTEQRKIEEMMIQNEKMLSVGGLAAGMAHEINNPLGAMVQNAQVVIQRLNSDNRANRRAAEKTGVTLEGIRGYMQERRIPDQLELIREAGKRAREIVNNMLSFARQGSADRSSHDIGSLLDRTIELASSEFNLRANYDFRKIRIVREYAPYLPMVPCEAGKIRQVLLNVLKNGAEAMYEKQKTLGEDYTPHFTLRTSIHDGMLRVEIEDNGPGMDASVQSRIFEPFYTTKPVGVGTGLGLSVSYFIITENHGGNMYVESTIGKGTVITIELPTGD